MKTVLKFINTSGESYELVKDFDGYKLKSESFGEGSISVRPDQIESVVEVAKRNGYRILLMPNLEPSKRFYMDGNKVIDRDTNRILADYKSHISTRVVCNTLNCERLKV